MNPTRYVLLTRKGPAKRIFQFNWTNDSMIYLYLIKEAKSFSFLNVGFSVGHNVFNLDFVMVLTGHFTYNHATRQRYLCKLKIKYKSNPNVI